jgi:hypothetical protein
MRNLTEMYEILKDNINSHTITLEGNTIIAKRKIKIRSFSNFKITYLKNGNEISYKNTSYDSYTLRFTNDQDLFCQLGSVSDMSILYTVDWDGLKEKINNPEEHKASMERLNKGLEPLGLSL